MSQFISLSLLCSNLFLFFSRHPTLTQSLVFYSLFIYVSPASWFILTCILLCSYPFSLSSPMFYYVSTTCISYFYHLYLLCSYFSFIIFFSFMVRPFLTCYILFMVYPFLIYSLSNFYFIIMSFLICVLFFPTICVLFFSLFMFYSFSLLWFTLF